MTGQNELLVRGYSDCDLLVSDDYAKTNITSGRVGSRFQVDSAGIVLSGGEGSFHVTRSHEYLTRAGMQGNDGRKSV